MAPVSGRVVAITGGARGIGRATAAELARRGARVAIGDLSSDDAQEAAASVRGEAIGLEVDVANSDSFAAFLEAVEERLGSIDVLVNNAGIMIVGELETAKAGAAAKVIDVNVKGVVHGMQLAVTRMRARGRGHVVNVLSAASWVAPPGLATYAASKHAGRGLTDAVRGEVRGAGLHVTAVYPGVVETDLSAGTTPTRGSRMITPEEVAEAITDVVEKPRPEVFVPRSLGVVLRTYQAAPPRLRGLVERVLKLDEAYGGVDPRSREEYEASLG
jgi:NAD(P)-dependent dehydrogenase (short-subunit alcohol dehydrogenase family)